jgi:Ser/Thr protein kinase RdoA (MazF antagonist)
MDTKQYWIDHFKSPAPEIHAAFLALKPSDCKEILEAKGIGYTDGISYESAENRVFGFDNAVVKFYRPGRWCIEAIKEEVEFLKDLEEAGVPFVRAIGTAGTYKGLIYLVYKKVESPFESDRMVLDIESARKMVHLAAKMHDVGAQRETKFRGRFDPEGMTAGCFEVNKKAGFIPKNLEGRYQKIVEELPKRIGPVEDIPVQRIHADSFSGNVLWQGDRPIFMDLDDLQMGSVATDIRLLSFPWRLDTLPETMDRKERRAIQHKMVLEFYREVREFPKEQERLFPYLGAIRDIEFDAWFSSHWNEPGFAEQYAEDDITKPKWWEENILALENIVKA